MGKEDSYEYSMTNAVLNFFLGIVSVVVYITCDILQNPMVFVGAIICASITALLFCSWTYGLVKYGADATRIFLFGFAFLLLEIVSCAIIFCHYGIEYNGNFTNEKIHCLAYSICNFIGRESAFKALNGSIIWSAIESFIGFFFLGYLIGVFISLFSKSKANAN